MEKCQRMNETQVLLLILLNFVQILIKYHLRLQDYVCTGNDLDFITRQKNQKLEKAASRESLKALPVSFANQDANLDHISSYAGLLHNPQR